MSPQPEETNVSESVSIEEVRALTAMADLPLEKERLGAMAELLSAWLPAANELSRKMSAPEHLQVVPITVLTHPRPIESGE